MIFIGQHHIMNQLRFILPDLYKNPDKGANILLRGPSGYGKTKMALEIASYLADKNFEIYWAQMSEFRFIKRVVFIDEVHLVKDVEYLFPYMDARKHVILFATNHDSVLPEAFANRCYEFVFDDYTEEELILIARTHSTFRTSDASFLEIIEAGNRNPRIIKSLVDRFGIYFRENPAVNPEEADFEEILESVFQITDGMDTLCRRYMETLYSVGGNASINLLKSILHVDEGTLKNQVEPVLLRKSLIRITSKGRCVNDSN